MTDELAVRRGRAWSLDDDMTIEEDDSGGGGKKEKRPPLWRWFSAQTAHSVPSRASAAQAVKERWNLAFIPFSRIDRALAKESSEHLVPFRELLDEYRSLFSIPDDDDNFARETGTGGKMLPFEPEICEKCKREAIPGTGMCARHGGQWITEKDLNDMSRRNKERIMVMAESALRALQDLLDNGKSEQVRMQAASTILDRAGLSATFNVAHSGSVTIETADEAMVSLQARMDQLALNAAKRAELETADIIDAEIVVDSEPEPVKIARA